MISGAVKSETALPANPEAANHIYTHGATGSLDHDGRPDRPRRALRTSARTNFGVRAVKGSWVNDQTFAVDFQYLGTAGGSSALT